MANTKALHARLALALVLAVMGVACAPTAAMPLPMLAAGHGPSHAHHRATPGGESAATTRAQ
jgi:hypothetical protein